MIKVLHKAFDLLESMAQYKNRSFTLSEIATMINEKPTTCANIVKTLCNRGFLMKVKPRSYVLGPVAQGLNYSDIEHTQLVESAREPMNALVSKYGASGVLAVLQRGRKKILDDYNSDSEVIINRTARASQELYTTSTGLVLSEEKSSFSAEEEALIASTYGSVEKMLELKQFITDHGYLAISLRPQVFEVAAAIRKDGRTIASIAAYWPEFLIQPNEKEQFIKEICELAKQISERMQKQ